MSPGTPNRIPLAMKLWLFRQRSGAARAASAQSADRIMSIESLEHIVRNRVRVIVRHTWLLVPPPASAKKGKKKSGKIEKIDQLAGRRVGIVTGNEATPDLLRAVLGHYGVPIAKVTVSEIEPNNIADAVKNNQVDVLFVAGAATGTAISEAVKAASRNGDAPSFVDIDQADGIAKRNPVFESIDIDAGTFGGT